MGLLDAVPGRLRPPAAFDLGRGAEVVLGLDLGQRADPTALAVVELQDREDDDEDAMPGTRPPVTHFLVRHLKALPLRTPYPQVVAYVGAVAAAIAGRTGEEPRLFVDATGLGQPVVDAFRAAPVPVILRPTYFTHGDRRSEEHGEVRLGKAWLVSRLQVLLQQQRIHLPRSRDAEALAKELLDYEIRVDERANDTYGAFKVGTHDDLVTAVGLACQLDRSRAHAWILGR
jgi:hypothetical protein